MSLFEHFVGLFIESAPWLLMGFTVAGLMKAFVPSELLAKHLGEPGLMATVKAALLGAPLPLCSLSAPTSTPAVIAVEMAAIGRIMAINGPSIA